MNSTTSVQEAAAVCKRDIASLITAALKLHRGVWTLQHDGKRYFCLGVPHSETRVEIHFNEDDRPVVFDAATQQRVIFERTSLMDIWKITEAASKKVIAALPKPKPTVLAPVDKFAGLRDAPFDWVTFAEVTGQAAAVAKAFLKHHIKQGEITDLGGGLYAVPRTPEPCRALIVRPPCALRVTTYDTTATANRFTGSTTFTSFRFPFDHFPTAAGALWLGEFLGGVA